MDEQLRRTANKHIGNSTNKQINKILQAGDTPGKRSGNRTGRSTGRKSQRNAPSVAPTNFSTMSRTETLLNWKKK